MFSIDEPPVGAFDVLDDDLHANMNITYFVKDVVATYPGVLLANLSMLSTQVLGVEITIVLSGEWCGHWSVYRSWHAGNL